MEILCMNENIDYTHIPAKINYYSNENFKIPAHWHTNIELEYVIHGKVQITKNGKARWISAGECIIIDSGSVHKLRTAPDEHAEGISLIFSNEYLKGICPDFENISFDLGHSPEKKRLFYETIEELFYIHKEQSETNTDKTSDQDTYTFLLESSYIQRILYLMMNDFVINNKQTQQTRAQITGQNQRIKLCIRYMEEHYCENLNAGEMAERTGVSREYFSRSFKKYTGTTFCEYLNTLRLSFAFRSLVSSKNSILDIAMESGFPDQRAFVRCFRGRYNCSPSEYRKQLKNHGKSQIVQKPVNNCEEIPSSRSYTIDESNISFK